MPDTTKPRGRTAQAKVHGHNFLQLVEQTNDNQRVADLLGIGYATVSTYKTGQQVPRPVELASKLLLLERNKDLPAVRMHTGIVRVPAEKKAAFDVVTRELGVKHTYFEW